MNGQQSIDEPRTQEKNLRDTGQGLVVWATCSIALIIVYALGFSSEGTARVLSIVSHGTMIAVAFGKCLAAFVSENPPSV